MIKLTDTQMEKFLNELLRDDHDFDDLSIAVSILIVCGVFDDQIMIEPDIFEPFII